MLIIAHRGGAKNWPENTLYAFKEARALGVDAIEIDLQLTRDGIPVAYRPRDLNILTNGRGAVKELNFSDMQSLNAAWNYRSKDGHPYGGDEIRIPALRDILREIPTVLLILDIKAEPSEPLIRALVDTVPESEWSRIILYSTNSDDWALVRRIKPDIMSFEGRSITRARLLECLVNRRCLYESQSRWIGFELDWNFDVMEQLERGPGSTRISCRAWSHDAVSCVRKMAPNAKIVLFGVNTEAQLEVAYELGVDAVYTDDPVLLIDARSKKDPQQDQGSNDGWVTPRIKKILTLLCEHSFYGLYDKHLEERKSANCYRYLVSDVYICFWFLLASFLLLLKDRFLPIAVFVAIYRILEIFLKEFCVTVFHTCKISRGNSVSSASRIIVLAIVNYLAAGLLFGSVYKIALFDVAGQPSRLETFQALVQGLSIQFFQGTVFAPKLEYIRIVILTQGFFCFLFVSIILSQFVSLSPLRSSEGKENADAA